jgi:hypothetical protein
MKRHLIGPAALACLLVAAAAGQAQYSPPGPGRSYFSPRGPNLSPYLNMLRGGDPAANYFLGVVPEQQRRYNERLFQSEIQELQRREEALDTLGLSTTLPGTGHPAVFNNTLSYFNNYGVRPGTPGAPATPAVGRRTP